MPRNTKDTRGYEEMNYRRDGNKITIIFNEKSSAEFMFTSKDDVSIATVMLEFIKLQISEGEKTK